MRRTGTLVIVLLCIMVSAAATGRQIWERIPSRPAQSVVGARVPVSFLSFRADDAALRSTFSAQARGGEKRLIDLPLPDGSFMTFSITETPMLPASLAARYPQLHTYTGFAVENATISAKLDYTTYGFHAMIYDGNNTALIDPAGNANDGIYTVHYKRDEVRNDDFSASCETLAGKAFAANALSKPQQKLLSGYELRKYRLALSCTHQYARNVTSSSTPSKADVLSKMTTTMNRVNGIYEREVSVTMVFADKEDTLIFVDSAADPLGVYNDLASSLLEKNQFVCDTLIGDANYDIGHSFSTGAGGLSSVGVICKTGNKGQCVTGSKTPTGDGFDVDYVAHEMGHEFGCDHTFNNSQNYACASNAVAVSAYEPGSGSTIMAYAGLCTGDNLQAHSDAYFHAASLRQIHNYITTEGDVCAVKTPTSNKPPGLATFTTEYTIPALTPFELAAPAAVDSVGGAVITYCWEEWDLGEFGKTLTATSGFGPIFRSYAPSLSVNRTFPNLKMLRSGTTSNAGIDKDSGEKLPTVARSLLFKLSVRSVLNNLGCFVLPDDSVRLLVAAPTGTTGFTVTSQNTSGISFDGFSEQSVTWNVAGTNAAPVSAGFVDIYLSIDSGKTWQYHLGKFPNNGAANVKLPNPDVEVAACRFKVKGTDNVFFNINAKDFSIHRSLSGSVEIYPIPASQFLHVVSDNSGPVTAVVFNAVGQKTWEGTINGNVDLPVYLWGRGVYILKLIDGGNRKAIKRFVVQ